MTPIDLAALVDAVHRDLLDEDHTDADTAVMRRVPLLATPLRSEVVRKVNARLAGLGPIEEILSDPDVSEVMINGPGQVWIERAGALECPGLTLDREEIDHLVERVVAPIGRRVDRRSPCVDGRLPDGSRVNVVVPPVALDGPYVTIRRFVLRELGLEAFTDSAVAHQIADSVATGANIMVSGGTGSGKTTLLNAVAGLVDPGARIITVEDAAELNLPHPHVVRLEARPASSEGVGELTIRDLVRNALRMRPDRLVVGEVRGDEALDLVQALNTGHRGCLSTIHANGPVDALHRLETLALLSGEGIPLAALRAQIAAALDLVIHVERSDGGGRRVSAVAEVTGPAEVRLITCRPAMGESS